MNVVAVIPTDGRLPPTIIDAVKSARHELVGEDIQYVIVDDSGDPENAAWLEETFHDIPQVHHEQRRGLGQTVRSAWQVALDLGADYIIHCEDDFTYCHKMNVNEWAIILDTVPSLAQLSLKRQPVNDAEDAAGGYMQCQPQSYYDRGMYVEHLVCYTYNPHILPRSIAELVLKHDGPTLEADVTALLIEHGYSFGVLGSVADPPRVTHIGTHRSRGYKV